MHMSTILLLPLTLMVSVPSTSGHRLARPVPFTCLYESESSVSRVMASDGGAVNRESPAKIAKAPVAAFLKLSDAADISTAEVDERVVVALAIRAPLKAEAGAKASAEGLSAEIATAITASFMVGSGRGTCVDHYCKRVMMAGSKRDRNGLEHSSVDEGRDTPQVRRAHMRMEAFMRGQGTFCARKNLRTGRSVEKAPPPARLHCRDLLPARSCLWGSHSSILRMVYAPGL